MKKFISMLFVCLVLVMSVGCADSKRIEGVVYQPYGLFNKDEKRATNIEYTVSWGNVVWGCLLFETIIAPVCIFGFYLFEPSNVK